MSEDFSVQFAELRPGSMLAEYRLEAQIGAGLVSLFDREHSGMDVDWEDTPRAPVGTARLVLDADIGIGALEVRHTDAGFHGGHRGGPFGDSTVADTVGNRACARATS